jgi:RNA polymerase sigma-70 factor, ECF subfamily
MKQHYMRNYANCEYHKMIWSTKAFHAASLTSSCPRWSNGKDMKQNKTKREDFEAQAMPQLEDLYRTALYMLDSESNAQDLVLESFVRAYDSWHKCHFSPNCRVWLFRIMVNVLMNKYRPSPSLSVAINSTDEIDGYLVFSRWINHRPIDDSVQFPFSAISQDHVKEAIRELPNDIRLMVVLSLLVGFSYREIAYISGINLETVKSRLHQGRKLMQRELFDHVECEGKYDLPADRVRSSRSG